jgi:hypothetical protein
MQKSLGTPVSQSHSSTLQVLTISYDVYNAMTFLDQLMAQSLEKIGKVRILDKQEQDLTGDASEI